MNHIHRLQQDLAAANARIAGMESAVTAFRAHLQTPKFTAPSELLYSLMYLVYVNE
jgi:hypothetical protein